MTSPRAMRASNAAVRAASSGETCKEDMSEYRYGSKLASGFHLSRIRRREGHAGLLPICGPPAMAPRVHQAPPGQLTHGRFVLDSVHQRAMTTPTETPRPETAETQPDGGVTIAVHQGIATVTFFHPKRNSLPAIVLRQLAEGIDMAAKNPEAQVVVLASEGKGAFCAGASFDELRAIRTADEGKEFFSGFARVILAMRRCPKI